MSADDAPGAAGPQREAGRSPESAAPRGVPGGAVSAPAAVRAVTPPRDPDDAAALRPVRAQRIAAPRRHAVRPAGRLPFVVAHRGASGELPELTLPAYARAIAQGADAIEVDVVRTRDGRLVTRHEPALAPTTDVARRADMLGRARGAGRDVEHAEQLTTFDLDLADVGRLRTRQRHPRRSHDHDDLFMVPTLAQTVGLLRRSTTTARRRPALHVELKSPELHASEGLPLEREVLRDLASHGWAGAGAPVLLQSFDRMSLLRLAGMTSLPLLQLARLDETGLDLTTERGLEAVATYAVGIGVDRVLLDVAGPDLVTRAHRRGLVVHVWTFAESTPREQASDAYDAALHLGADALITDYPAEAVAARDRWALELTPAR